MTKRIIFSTALLTIFAILSFAQTDTVIVRTDTVKYWKRGGFASLIFNQVNLSNWIAGGENAISTTTLFNIFANYKKDKLVWDNSLDLGYGLMRSGNRKLRKNEDKIDLVSKFGYKAVGNFYYSVLFNYRTQFTDGFNYPNDSTQILVSRFNAPAYISISIGMDFKPYEFLSIYFSPAAGKATIVSDKTLSDLGMFGVEKGKKVRYEFGASFNAKFQKDVIKNVNVLSKLILFNNYTDREKSNRANIDVNWEVMVNIKANKYLTTSIFTNLIYDQNVIAKTQFKEVLGVGVSYKF